jgi:putative transposase
MIDPKIDISIARQCELLGLPHSTFYYQAQGESAENLRLMRAMDEKYLEHPFYGSRRMAAILGINRKRASRLMQKMGLEAIYPKRNLSQPGKPSERFPYLLKGLAITRPNQVWGTDITYIPIRGGFLYLVAILDWYSRHVLAWDLSNTLDRGFCIQTLRRALEAATPEIFNNDQGSQFTSQEFVSVLKEASIRISWDGKGRALDNVFVERLWRAVKYEEVYLHDYQSGLEAWSRLDNYFRFYSNERPHQSLDYKTPASVYFSLKGNRDPFKGSKLEPHPLLKP